MGYIPLEAMIASSAFWDIRSLNDGKGFVAKMGLVESSLLRDEDCLRFGLGGGPKWCTDVI